MIEFDILLAPPKTGIGATYFDICNENGNKGGMLALQEIFSNLYLVVIFLCYSIVLAIAFLIFALRWLNKRHYFPIRESSPHLMLLSAFIFVLNMLSFPIARISDPWTDHSTSLMEDNTVNRGRLLAVLAVLFRIFALLPYFLR